MLSLVWAVLFLFLMLMMTSLVFVQRMTEFRLHECKNDSDHDICPTIHKWFGTVADAMMTLFMSATGGIGWGDVYDIVMQTGVDNAVLFVSYILFFLLAFFNIVTSIFVNRALQVA